MVYIMQLINCIYLQPKNFINQNIHRLILWILKQKKFLEGFFQASEQTIAVNFIISVDSIIVTVHCWHQLINSSCTFTTDTLWGFHAILDYIVDIVRHIRLKKQWQIVH